MLLSFAIAFGAVFWLGWTMGRARERAKFFAPLPGSYSAAMAEWMLNRENERMRMELEHEPMHSLPTADRTESGPAGEELSAR